MRVIHEVMFEGDRLDDAMRERILQGLCAWQTNFAVPHLQWCERVLTGEQIKQGQIDCDEHERVQRNHCGYAMRIREEDRAYVLGAVNAEH